MARTILQQDAGKLNEILAEHLKKMPQFKVPEWAFFVKSGSNKKRVPADPDFWYKRTASILRQLYIHGVVGVSSLRTKYGGKKNRGVKPFKRKKASGKIIRLILQQAESAGLVEKVTGRQFGRRLTTKGKQLLDSIKVNQGEGEALGNRVGALSK
jgi:small subunit ribosomal protein S19e